MSYEGAKTSSQHPRKPIRLLSIGHDADLPGVFLRLRYNFRCGPRYEDQWCNVRGALFNLPLPRSGHRLRDLAIQPI